jgi:hypothetical protein
MTSVAFIHIGKTGGTTINELLKKTLKNYKHYHLKNDYKDNEKYVIWIRNPIHRFVSAFNHVHSAVNVHSNTIETFDLDHCIVPVRLRNSKDRNYLYSPEYDNLVKQFSSPNHLAESLTSTDTNLRNRAIELMKHEEEHLFKGLYWYLEKCNFVKNKLQNIYFVGRTEFMKEDIVKLSDILNVKLDENLKLRENKFVDPSMKYLSPLAIQNIKHWYHKTDYSILRKMVRFGLIDQNTYDSYCRYE